LEVEVKIFKMEPKHFLVLGLVLVPFVLTERQCTESGQRNVNAHIENVVDETLDNRTYDLDNVVRASSQVINEVLLPQFERILDLKMGQIKTEMMQEMKGTLEEMMVPFKKEVMDTVEAMKIPLKAELEADFDQQIVSASTSIVRNIIVPDLDDKLSAKVEALKVPLKEELTNTVVAMKIPLKSELKEELTGTVEAMKTPLKAELKADFDQQITNRLEEQVPDLDTIVTASSTIANNILMPQMEQKVTIKVNEIRGIVKNELKSELDQDLSSGMTDLSQQIVTKINEREEAIDEKIIFAVVRKTDVAAGQSITFDTVIANIGESMDATSGTFTAKRQGLYMFTFTTVSQDAEKRVLIQVLKNGAEIFVIEDGNSKNQSNISYSWMLQLVQGDIITLTNHPSYNGLHGCSNDWIHFTGQLLNAT